MAAAPAARLATPAELAAAYRIRAVVFIDEQSVPPELERDEYDERCDHAVALVDGELVGTARMVTEGVTGIVGRMAVLAPARGSGVGGALLGVLEARARERGLTRIELHAQTHARGFYERHGYAAEGDEYDEAGIPHVTMAKSI